MVGPWEDYDHMKAMVQTGYGEPERVLRLAEVERPGSADRRRPDPGEGDRVNTPDWIVVAGVPYVLRLRAGLRRPSMAVRGTDVAGVVQEVGSAVTDLRPGDEVFGSLWENAAALHPPGTFAELTVAPASQVIEKPARLSFQEAGAAVMSGLTALLSMRDVGRVQPGAKVLVNGASGGVGTFAVQIAKALGAEVTGVCSTRNVDLVRVARRRPRHRPYGTGLHPRRAALRRDPRQRVEPPAVRDGPCSGAVGHVHPEQRREHRRPARRPPRMARARSMRRSTDVKFVTCVVNRENLSALAASSNQATSAWSSTTSSRSRERRPPWPTCWVTTPAARSSSRSETAQSVHQPGRMVASPSAWPPKAISSSPSSPASHSRTTWGGQ